MLINIDENGIIDYKNHRKQFIKDAFESSSRPDQEQRYYEYFPELQPINEKPLIEYGWEEVSSDEDPFPSEINDNLINQLNNDELNYEPDSEVINKMDASSSITSASKRSRPTTFEESD